MSEEINTSDFLFYQGEDGKVRVQIILGDETVWATQKSLSDIFNTSRENITYHISNIFKEGELDEISVCKEILHTASDGKNYKTKFYNLDAIISIGYRVNSYEATQFRVWATSILKEYMIKGFALDDERLKQGKEMFGKDYFDELLERIKEIRTSERRFYQKITDIYSQCSIDYDSQSPITQEFYATVQNKLHFAITNHTAAEIVQKRADSKKKNMGLTTWKNSPEGKILKTDITVAKNYYNDQELNELNDIVNFYLDFAENRARRQKGVKMSDWIVKLDEFLKFNEYEVLTNAGKVSAKLAKQKAESEFSKFRISQDKNFVSDFDKITKNIKESGKLPKEETPNLLELLKKMKEENREKEKSDAEERIKYIPEGKETPSLSRKKEKPKSDFDKKLIQALKYDPKGKSDK